MNYAEGVIELNHTIVFARDKRAAAAFLADVLGLPSPTEAPPFVVVQLSNRVTLDFSEPGVSFIPAHYAFLVDEATFDAALARLRARAVPFYPGPRFERAGEINTNDGGRGLYFRDLDGHGLELITVPYGGWPAP
jgi:catechol 2,3-dioxygenase-like lactoylglutathione lyase family enzyme